MSGIEIEITAMPLPDLTIISNINYSEGKYIEYFDEQLVSCDAAPEAYCGEFFGLATIPLDRTDEDMPYLVPVSVFLALQYDVYLPIGRFTPRIEASYKESHAGHFDRGSWESQAWQIPTATIYNARLTWDLPDEATRIAFFGRNLTDEFYVNGGIPNITQVGLGGTTFSQPKMYGVEVFHNF